MSLVKAAATGSHSQVGRRWTGFIPMSSPSDQPKRIPAGDWRKIFSQKIRASAAELTVQLSMIIHPPVPDPTFCFQNQQPGSLGGFGMPRDVLASLPACRLALPVSLFIRGGRNSEEGACRCILSTARDCSSASALQEVHRSVPTGYA